MVGKNNLVGHPETWNAVVPASKPFNILTGNGITKVKDEIQLASAAFGEQIRPILLEHSPAALATGYRCKELGYGFYWPPYADPFMVKPFSRSFDPLAGPLA